MNKPTPKIYRTTNWPAYNRALMSRGNIAIWFEFALLRNGMLHQKANKGEIKSTPTQPSNAT